MTVEAISSRKNSLIAHMRALGRDRAYRREAGEFLCDGEKLLREALEYGAKVKTVLTSRDIELDFGADVRVCRVTEDIVDYVSPLKNSPGPLFSCEIPSRELPEGGFVILEGVQDPGNVGTVLRSAGAFGFSAVLLVGACADPYNFKTVRAAMGATFRVPAIETDIEALKMLGVPIYGAALSEGARSILDVELKNAAVAIGSEGSGLSSELLEICAGQIIIPMSPDCESLNAAVAASIVMWETARRR